MDQLNDSRQAGAEIEITPDMIEAGRDAFWSYDPDDVGGDFIVEAIFKAMVKSSPKFINYVSDQGARFP